MQAKTVIEAWQSHMIICVEDGGVLFFDHHVASFAGNMTFSSSTDNVTAALGKSNRVCEVALSGPGLVVAIGRNLGNAG